MNFHIDKKGTCKTKMIQIIFFSFLLVFGLGLGLTLPITQASAATTVSIANLTSEPGKTVNAPISISNVDNYGTGTISITYDPVVVHVTSVSSGPDSTVTGWSADNTSGIVIISAWNTGGVSGNIIFANVTFQAVRSAGSTTLNISVTTLKDISQHDIPAIINNGSFSILRPSTSFMVCGYVFYENGSECNNPEVTITNLNTSNEWRAETHINENYYRIKLNGGVDVDTAEVLQFEVTSPAHSQSNTVLHTVTLEEINLGGVYNFNISLKHNIFDTREGTYPSIFGAHHGNFTPKRNITVRQMYTYPCAGTGGHSERVIFCDYETGARKIDVSWNGYQCDYHNITVSPPVELLKNHVYNYTIITGSYPQIIHRQSYENDCGIITCTEFMDANGREYSDWIPAIKLF